MAKVDIVIPCYNYGRFLSACVASVLEQSLGDLHVLIIDDASSDDSLLVARQLAEADHRVSVVTHSDNWGHIRTYNQGINWASAEYFLLLSADDMLVPGALERAAAVLDANPDIVLTYGKAIHWQDNLPFPRIADQQHYTWTRQDLVREICDIGANVVDTPTAVGRTRVQKVIGGYRASLPHSADMEMWLRYGAQGPIAQINAVQAIYRKHTINMSNSYWNEDWSDYPHRAAAFESFFDHYMDRLDNHQRLRAKAYRVLAETAFWRGLSRIRRGRIRSGIQLFRFSIEINPGLLVGLPAASVLRHAANKLFRSA